MSDVESSGENHSAGALEPDSSSESSEEQVVAKLVAPPTTLPPPPGPPTSMPPPPVMQPPPTVLEPKVDDEAAGGPPSLELAADAPTPPPAEDLSSRFYKVLWDYPNTEQEADTLTLHVGDILIVLETRADGWWRGQSGSEVGLFPVAYCEAVSEEEVKAFIAQSESRQKKAAPGAGGPSRAELEKEMKDLVAEEAELAAKAHQLKEEVAAMKEEARKLRKKTREELLEIFDALPACLYHIPTFSNIQHDLVRCAIQVGRILDIELEHKDVLPDVIQECSTFVEEGPKAVAADPKLKAELDKTVSKVLAIQKYLLDDHANVNIDLSRKVIDDLDTLAAQINAFTRGEISTTPTPVEDRKTVETSSSPKEEVSTPPAPTSELAAEDPESTPVSPREKKKKKRDRGTTATLPPLNADADGSGESPGTPDKESKDKEKKKSKRKDKEPTSPRSPKRATIEGPTAEEMEQGAVPDIPVSPRRKEKEKEKKSKRKRETAEADEAEA